MEANGLSGGRPVQKSRTVIDSYKSLHRGSTGNKSQKLSKVKDNISKNVKKSRRKITTPKRIQSLNSTNGVWSVTPSTSVSQGLRNKTVNEELLSHTDMDADVVDIQHAEDGEFNEPVS